MRMLAKIVSKGRGVIIRGLVILFGFPSVGTVISNQSLNFHMVDLQMHYAHRKGLHTLSPTSFFNFEGSGVARDARKEQILFLCLIIYLCHKVFCF
jgi:hypothetical protein